MSPPETLTRNRERLNHEPRAGNQNRESGTGNRGVSPSTWAPLRDVYDLHIHVAVISTGLGQPV